MRRGVRRRVPPGATPHPAEAPFGLGGLLKGQQREGRTRRLTRAAWLAGGGLATLAVAGAWLAPRVSEALRRPFRPPPGPEADAYLAAWAAGDLDALYGRLTPEARRAADRDAFRQQHLDLAATMTLQRLTLTPDAGGAAPAADGDGAGVPFRAVYATDRFGELRRDNVLPLRWRDGAWRVAWTPEVLLPDLAGGRTLRAFPDPAGRGGVLDRQHRPLAVSPPGGPRRQYPQGPLAGPLTGYVDGNSAGRAELEAATDDLLAGHPGGRLTVLAPSGEIASTLSSAPARPGETVTLTLDLDLQRACEAALGERAGSVVVLDARDGAVLALASYPQYDPNTFVGGGDVGAILTDPRQPLVNRPLVGLYPPGSIFKAVTMAAGLERGVVRPDSEFVCTGRWTGLPGLSFDCWLRAGHGRLNLVSGLTQSCNCVFYEVGKLLDEQEANALPDVAVRSGFGGATGTVPGLEPGGTVPSPQWKRQALNDGWARGDAVNMAIGQGQLLVTPLQVAALYAAIAGGGQRKGPRLLDRAQLPGGDVERLLPPAAKPPLPWSAGHPGSDPRRAARGRRRRRQHGRRRLPGLTPGRRHGREDRHRQIRSRPAAPRLVRLLRPGRRPAGGRPGHAGVRRRGIAGGGAARPGGAGDRARRLRPLHWLSLMPYATRPAPHRRRDLWSLAASSLITADALLGATLPRWAARSYRAGAGDLPGENQIRALWVDAFHDGIKSVAQIDRLIADALFAGINTLIVQVRRAATPTTTARTSRARTTRPSNRGWTRSS